MTEHQGGAGLTGTSTIGAKDGKEVVGLLAELADVVERFASAYALHLAAVEERVRADFPAGSWSEADMLDLARTLNVGHVGDVMAGLAEVQNRLAMI